MDMKYVQQCVAARLPARLVRTYGVEAGKFLGLPCLQCSSTIPIWIRVFHWRVLPEQVP